jgi:hypothetical protein
MMPVRRQKNINCCQIRRLPTVQDGIKSAHWLWLIGFTQELLMAKSDLDVPNATPGQSRTNGELKSHSRSKSPVKKIAVAMKRTIIALRQTHSASVCPRPSPMIEAMHE